jgi:hypothetical protein
MKKEKVKRAREVERNTLKELIAIANFKEAVIYLSYAFYGEKNFADMTKEARERFAELVRTGEVEKYIKDYRGLN